MELRLVQAVVLKRWRSDLEALLEDFTVVSRWFGPLDDDQELLSLLLPATRLEGLLDALEKRYGDEETFRLVLLPVEATVPRVSNETKEEAEEGEEKDEKEKQRLAQRVSREELYHDIETACNPTPAFFAAVTLATVVAAVGLLQNSTAAIIGAMVIAPLLGPNAGLALATTLADPKLARRALVVNAAGVSLTFAVAVAAGLIFGVDIAAPEVLMRTHVGTGDIVLALAAGVAGSLAFTTGVPTVLVGVMVAVALLPPAVVCGMLAATADWPHAGRAFLLLLVNITCINLSAVATFWVQGIRPNTWWEEKRARRATYISIALWVGLLVVLAVLINVIGEIQE